MIKTLLAALLATVAPESLTPLLVPVYVRDTPGALGSRWTSELRAFADREEGAVLFPQYWECGITTCPPTPLYQAIQGRVLTHVQPGYFNTVQVPGVILYTARDHADQLHMNLRVRDTSVNAVSAGTELPVVRESDLSVSTLQLLGIRTGSRFRNTLRVYDVDARPGARVRISIINRNNTVFNIRDTAFVTTAAWDDRAGVPLQPGYIEIPIEQALGGVGNYGPLRIEVEPGTPGLRFWAFVATTDNETQQVTVVTP